MLTFVRMRERNVRLKRFMRDYGSARGTIYRSPENGLPGEVVPITDEAEIAELEAIEQFEIIRVENDDELRARLRGEVETRIRSGEMPIASTVREGKEAEPEPDVARRVADNFLPPEATEEAAPAAEDAPAPKRRGGRQAKQ